MQVGVRRGRLRARDGAVLLRRPVLDRPGRGLVLRGSRPRARPCRSRRRCDDGRRGRSTRISSTSVLDAPSSSVTVTAEVAATRAVGVRRLRPGAGHAVAEVPRVARDRPVGVARAGGLEAHLERRAPALTAGSASATGGRSTRPASAPGSRCRSSRSSGSRRSSRPRSSRRPWAHAARRDRPDVLACARDGLRAPAGAAVRGRPRLQLPRARADLARQVHARRVSWSSVRPPE